MLLCFMRTTGGEELLFTLMFVNLTHSANISMFYVKDMCWCECPAWFLTAGQSFIIKSGVICHTLALESSVYVQDEKCLSNNEKRWKSYLVVLYSLLLSERRRASNTESSSLKPASRLPLYFCLLCWGSTFLHAFSMKRVTHLTFTHKHTNESL